MKRDDIVQLLRDHREELGARFGVKSLAIFGSVARDDAETASDVDLLVEFLSPPGFDGYMNLKFFLEELLNKPVDLVMKKALRPDAIPVVEEEAVRVA